MNLICTITGICLITLSELSSRQRPEESFYFNASHLHNLEAIAQLNLNCQRRKPPLILCECLREAKTMFRSWHAIISLLLSNYDQRQLYCSGDRTSMNKF